MKRLFLFLTTCLSFFVSFAQTDNSLARVEKYNNKLVFFYNEPINDYEQAFTFENKIENLNCLPPTEIFAATIKNANLEAANQSKLYDAIIVNSAGRDMAIVFKDKSKDNAIARVKRTEGKFVFIQCEPVSNYTMIGKYNVSGVGQQLILGTCPSYQEKISKLIKKANKENTDFDGVILGSEKFEQSIKFK